MTGQRTDHPGLNWNSGLNNKTGIQDWNHTSQEDPAKHLLGRFLLCVFRIIRGEFCRTEITPLLAKNLGTGIESLLVVGDRLIPSLINAH